MAFMGILNLITSLFSNISPLQAIILPILGGVCTLTFFWLRSLVIYNHQQLQELKELTTELIELWASMIELVDKILLYAHWTRNIELTHERTIVCGQIIENCEIDLINLRNQTIRKIGRLYFYIDGITLQNKIQMIVDDLAYSHWRRMQYSAGSNKK